MRAYRGSNLFNPFREAMASLETSRMGEGKRVLLVAFDGGTPLAERGWPGLGFLPYGPEIRNAMVEPPYPPGRILPVQPPGESYFARPVQGEVVRDQAGRYYELVGDQVRPLGNLVRGSNGGVFELATASTPFAAQPLDFVDAELEEETRNQPSEDSREEHWPPGSPATSSHQDLSKFRKLFAEPGVRCLVRLGDFKDTLALQLENPSRVRENHRLPCYLQIYESTSVQPISHVFGADEQSGAYPVSLQPLTRRAVEQLGLAGVLPPPPRRRQPVQRDPNLILPYDRFFHLQVVQDPTAENARSAASDAAPVAPSPAAMAAHTAAKGNTAAARSLIPEPMVKPWEFIFSREEVLSEMRIASALHGPIRRVWRQIKSWFTGRSEFRKWQAMLFGKTVQEQLWTVRPPLGSLEHPRVKAWARRMLALAGFDPGTTILEWEIFWKRKGV